MQKINLRDLYPDTYKTDVFVDVAEEVLAAIRAEDMAKGIFIPVSQLPRQEPRKAALPASAAV